MLTTIIVLLSIVAYAVVGVLVTKKSRNDLYRKYFKKELHNNLSRTREDPDHERFMNDHRSYSALYANRRKWCEDRGYKMPESWILADYDWSRGWTLSSQKSCDSREALLDGVFWPFMLTVMAVMFAYQETLGKVVEPATMSNHRKQLNQADQLAAKAKETLELANTFRKDDIGTYNLLRDTAEGMKEQAEQLRKLTA